MREIHPAMHMNPADGMRRFRIEDALDDAMIAEAQATGVDREPQETTLQRICRELRIEYSDAMRAQEAELTRLAELGQMSARDAELINIIEQYDKTPHYHPPAGHESL